MRLKYNYIYFLVYIFIPVNAVFFTFFYEKNFFEYYVLSINLIFVFFIFINNIRFCYFNSLVTLFFLFVLAVKFSQFFTGHGPYSLSAGLMELKGLFYFYFLLLRYNFKVSINYTLYALSYAILILFAFVITFYTGGRLSVLSEANYDALILLLLLTPYFYGQLKLKKSSFLLIVSSLFVTLSKTINIVFLLLVSYKSKGIYRIFVFLLSLILIVFVFIARDVTFDSFLLQDRFIFMFSFFDIVNSSSFLEVLFGYDIFRSITSDANELAWYVTNYTDRHGTLGVYPFLFHGQHFRSFLAFGLLFYFSYCILFFNECLKTGKLYIFFIFFLCSFTMSTFYLNVSFLLFLLLMKGFPSNANK